MHGEDPLRGVTDGTTDPAIDSSFRIAPPVSDTDAFLAFATTAIFVSLAYK
jgi:hypothetical protein